MIQKHRLRILTASVQLALVAPVFALTGIAAAQNSSRQQDNDSQLSQITVEAEHNVQKKQVGMSCMGIPIEGILMSRHVGFQRS